MARIDRIETRIVDIPTIRGHVLSMTTMRVQSAVLVTIRFADGSTGTGEGTTIGGLAYGPESPESIRSAIDGYLIPTLDDQNPWAQARRPMEVILAGWATSLFQAPQQWATMSS